MALSAFPVVFGNASAASTTAVAPTVVIPDNAHTVVLFNPTATDAFVGRAAVGVDGCRQAIEAMRAAAGG
jgi:hypothetical protein